MGWGPRRQEDPRKPARVEDGWQKTVQVLEPLFLNPAPPAPWCQVLSDEHAREMCLRFADMECKLGEIDRARAIYSFCSQICDPRVGCAQCREGEGGQWGCCMKKHLAH